MSTISDTNYFYSISTIKAALNKAISSVTDNIECYSAHPDKDFTRNRKMSCEDLIRFIFQLSNKTVQSALMSASQDIDSMPSSSAI